MSLLQLTALTKVYLLPGGGLHRVVDVAEFALAAGEQRALRGESGSGKTTFLHLIAGILAPDAGRVALDGRDLAALGEAGGDRLYFPDLQPAPGPHGARERGAGHGVRPRDRSRACGGAAAARRARRQA